MYRLNLWSRPFYRLRNRRLGFDYDEPGYWRDSAYYRFSPEEADQIYRDTDEIHAMALDYVGNIRDEEVAAYRLSDEYAQWMLGSRGLPSLYGRLDLAVGGPRCRLLEYNADTPTVLLEAAVIQWRRFGGRAAQFNNIHEALIEAWRRYRGIVHFSYLEGSREDYRTVEYLADCAVQAGLTVQLLPIEQIGSDGRQLFGLDDQPIEQLFKLYPYEWLMRDRFGPVLTKARCRLIEPPWKYLLADKLALVHLWARNPGHPCLLEAHRRPFGGWTVQKPRVGREGRNIKIVDAAGETVEETTGPYGGDAIYQRYIDLPKFGPYRLVVGSWLVDGRPVGIGCREGGRITGNLSGFVPHRID